MAQVVRQLKKNLGEVDPNVLLGLDAPDDAAVYRINDEIALVQTVDFFTPIVDEPEDWGAIAAANSMSDVYAMGGRPVTALNIVGWPQDLDFGLLGRVLVGAAAKAREGGLSIIGGHTVDDPEPKFGMSVTGFVHPDEIVRSSAARPGMSLVLTKPLGTGVIATAIKRGAAETGIRDEAVRVMSALNASASRAMKSAGSRAATDVTGFGFLGHLSAMLSLSGAAARVSASSVPVIDGAEDLAAGGFVPGGTRRNEQHYGQHVTIETDLPEARRTILFDAQTSGGLLIAIESDRAGELVDLLAKESTPASAIVGEVVEGEPGSISVQE